jgi:hypothetical protein
MVTENYILILRTAVHRHSHQLNVFTSQSVALKALLFQCIVVFLVKHDQSDVLFLHHRPILLALEDFPDDGDIFVFGSWEDVVMVGLMLRTEARWAKVKEAIVADMLSSQDISATTLLETIVEHVKLAVFAIRF